MDTIPDISADEHTIYRVITRDGQVVRYSPQEWTVSPMPVGLQLVNTEISRYVLIPWHNILRFDAMPDGAAKEEQDAIDNPPF